MVLASVLAFVLACCIYFFVVYYYPDMNKTPFREGSSEWVGYTSAEANGFLTKNDCVDDPETVAIAGFVDGCMRYITDLKK